MHTGLGKVMLGLGLVGLVRLLPEIFQMGRTSQYYAVLVTADAALAVLTGAAGEGLWKGKPWAPRLALRAGGVLVATSIGLGLLIAPALVNPAGGLRFAILARLLYYAISVAFWPYAVRALIRAAPAESRRSLTLTFIAWLVLGIPLLAFLFLVFR